MDEHFLSYDDDTDQVKSWVTRRFFVLDPKLQASLEARLKQKEEACREAESRRVEVELRLVEVKESLRKAEAGPFTLGTTLDSSLLDTPGVSPSSRTGVHGAESLIVRTDRR